MNKNVIKLDLENIFKDLVDYGNTHLKDEEECFDKYNYPEKEEHKELHKKYIEKIKKIA